MWSRCCCLRKGSEEREGRPRGRVQRPAPSQHGPRSRASLAEAQRELQFPETVIRELGSAFTGSRWV